MVMVMMVMILWMSMMVGAICDGDGDDDFTWKMVIESYIKSSTVAEDDDDSCDEYDETSD